jgi:iron complex outermembrane receptor protein
LPPPLGGDNSGLQDSHSTSYAAFGQITVPFASIWELTLGGRLTHDRKRVFQEAIPNGPPGQPLGFPFFPGSPYAVPASAHFTKPTWRASLSVEPAPGKRIYASYDRGYKSGSFTSQAQNAVQATFLVKPEQMDSFNVGVKTQWLDNRLRVNADAYYILYKDLQVFEFGNALNFVLSNADATIKGVELQMVAAPSRHLNAGATFSYMDAVMDTNPAFAGAVLPYKGNRLSRSPKYKISTFVEANADVANGELLGRVSYNFQDSYYYNPSNDVASLQESYGVLGAFLSWESADGLKFSVAGDNLLNTKYTVHHISFQAMGLRIFAPPRSFTFTVSKKF